jgi:archaeal flagellar protein FlaH
MPPQNQQAIEQEREHRYNQIILPRDELSMNLGGGLPKNSLMLASGPDGAGKSIFAQRLCYGFLRNKTSVTYISSELDTIAFVEQMASLDYDIKYDLLNNDLLFLPMFPTMGKTKLSPEFMDRLLVTRQIFENEIIIFDTLSFLLISDHITNNKIYDLIGMLKKLTTLGKTIIFMVDPEHLNKTLYNLLKSVSDIYMNLEINTFAGNLVRVLKTIRFKRPEQNFSAQIPFRIETGKGLAIEIASLD